jgi:hypothetical protein
MKKKIKETGIGGVQAPLGTKGLSLEMKNLFTRSGVTLKKS